MKEAPKPVKETVKEAPKPVVKETVKEAPKPKVEKVIDPKKEAIKKSFLEEAEEIIPRIDEETLNKYQDFLEEKTYNTPKGAKKKNNQEETIKARKKNSNKNKRSKNVESRTSNIPQEEVIEDHVLYYEKGMTVMEVAEAMHIGVTDLVKKLPPRCRRSSPDSAPPETRGWVSAPAPPLQLSAASQERQLLWPPELPGVCTSSACSLLNRECFLRQ